MKPKILLVDNVPEFLAIQARLLEIDGYQVLTASSGEEASTLLEQNWIHLAIIDQRLEDENDAHDISGLILAQKEQFRTIPKIILTAYPDYQSAVSALRTLKGYSSALEYIAKQKNPKELSEAVARAFAYHVRINWNLVIDWKARDRFSLVNLIEPGLDGERLLNRAEELEDLFRRLFYEKQQIRVDRLLWQREGRVALTVFAFKEDVAPESFVVVCGQNAAMTEETRRYREFAPKAPGDTGTALGAAVQTTHFAANPYTLAGADLENVHTLRELYRAGPEKSFNAALNTLFQKTLAEWQPGPYVSAQTRTLDEVYRECLGLSGTRLSREALEERIQAVLRQIPALGQKTKIERNGDTQAIRFDGKLFSYPDPTHLLFQMTNIGSPVVLINTPGTLSGENILTDKKEEMAAVSDGTTTAKGETERTSKMVRTWLTDFADTGPAPLLWNYVSLEAGIRFDWVEEKDLQRLHEMENCLLNDSQFSKPDANEVEPTVRKPVRAIQPIRRLAARIVGKDPLPYHLGIFFHAAYRLADFNPALPLTPNELARLAHTLFAMAMIAAKMNRTEQRSLPSVATSETGIRIDKANRAVYRDGKRIRMRGQSYDLLCHLHDHADRLCTRQEIIEQVFKEVYAEKDQSQIGRLNTAVRRLREKIEADPEHPHCVVSEPGAGYRLIINPAA